MTPPGGNVRRVTSAVFWNFFGKTFLLGVRFSESIILVRLLGREEYGLYGSLINIEAIVVLVISLGLESAISRFAPQFTAEGDIGKLRGLLSRIFRMRALLLIPAALVLVAGGSAFSDTFFHGLIPPWYLRAVFVLVVIVSFHSLFRTFLDSFFHVKYISLVDALTQAGYLVLAVLLIDAGYGLVGVFIALIASQTAAAFLLYFRYRRTLEGIPDSTGGRSEVGKKRVIGYSWSLYLLGILLYVLGKGLDVLLIGILLGDLTQVAYYIIAFNLAYYSLSVMDIAVSANFVVSLIVEAHTAKDFPLLRKIFTGLFEFIYIYCLPVAAGGLLLAGAIVDAVYGTESHGAVPLMMLFIAAMTIGKLSSVTAYFLIILDRERTVVLERGIFGVVNLLLALYLIPRHGALGAVAATSVVMVGITAYEAFLLRGLIAPRYSARFLVTSVLSAAVMAGSIWVVDLLWTGPAGIKLPVVVAGGALLYLAGIRILQPFSSEVQDLLRGTEYPFRHTIVKILALKKRA